MSDTRYKKLFKDEVPKANQTPKVRGRWTKGSRKVEDTEKRISQAKSGIATVTSGQTIQKLMGTESISRVSRKARMTGSYK